MALIHVQATRDDRRVALSETSKAHPGGEAFVAGDGRIVQVALTPEVSRRIAQGDLRVVDDPDPVDALLADGGAQLGALVDAVGGDPSQAADDGAGADGDEPPPAGAALPADDPADGGADAAADAAAPGAQLPADAPAGRTPKAKKSA